MYGYCFSFGTDFQGVYVYILFNTGFTRRCFGLWGMSLDSTMDQRKQDNPHPCPVLRLMLSGKTNTVWRASGCHSEGPGRGPTSA